MTNPTAGEAPRFVFVGGGARSGKSRFALTRAFALGRRRLFVATAEPSDDEMRDRIARHRQQRGSAFDTVEAPMALPEVIADDRDHDVIVVDCLTLWLSNLLVRSAGATDPPAPGAADLAIRRLDALVEALRSRRVHVVLVSNEVGMGLVPETPLGRLFRDLAGGAHQRLAAIADEVYLAATGVVLRLRPAPVEVMGG
jgi:adenosylcobinamide kinase/adenosylcobinamide-phosphate guanylyltransferase